MTWQAHKNHDKHVIIHLARQQAKNFKWIPQPSRETKLKIRGAKCSKWEHNKISNFTKSSKPHTYRKESEIRNSLLYGPDDCIPASRKECSWTSTHPTIKRKQKSNKLSRQKHKREKCQKKGNIKTGYRKINGRGRRRSIKNMPAVFILASFLIDNF